MVLVIALAALAVMMVLLLALFAGVSHQLRGAQGDASLAREKLLADSAVALVMGQIAEASTQTNVAWISQPGLLRTYGTNSVRTPTSCYKLYSTSTLTSMIDTSGNLDFLASDIPANWNSEPAQYTDLNAPQSTTSGQTVYPILDPGALTNAANLAAGTQVSGVSSDTGAVTMPVAWLYELQDGTLGPASNGTGANPIVARIAFWTDDNTCKININTAGCGSPWNTPRVNSTDDVAWGTTQPAEGEYSAYTGHPAMTSLAAVFGTNAYSPQQLLGLTPRYAWGGSQFGAQTTTAGEAVPTKMDRLYASVDELSFNTNLSSGQRQTNPVSAAQLEMARFVLTEHSESPETTLLGEPRIAIWPVADSTSASAPRITATDSAIANAAMVGIGTTNTRSYFFERHNAQSPTDDLSTNYVPSNVQLFGDLVNRGNLTLPGYGTTLSAKYPGAEWTQLMLEIVDYIRSINAVDPTPVPFVSYAAGNSTNGVGFVDPLMTSYGSGASQVTLRGMGRCPTLSSLTLVFYVCGFGFTDGTSIDYDANPDTTGSSWTNNFAISTPTNRWKKVNSELVRAFAVPCFFQPGCAYPEVSEPCTVQISGLNKVSISVTGATSPTYFGFAPTATSRNLSDALTVLPADRMWGGNEGPSAWRAAAIDAMASGSTWSGYPFAGTNSCSVPLKEPNPTLDSLTGGPSEPASWARAVTIEDPNGVKGAIAITVNILDPNGVILQTLNLSFPEFSVHAPTIDGECDHADGSTPATANTNWATNPACQVTPSYYMTLRNRLLATQNSRATFIQAGDISRSVEACTDLRMIAGITNVPSSFFASTYASAQVNAMGGSDAQNIHFADGTSACFAPYNPPSTNSATDNNWPVQASYPKSIAPLITVTDWDSKSAVPYYQFTNAACSVPTGTKLVTMQPVQNVAGDWDTGPGFSPDGAQINLPDSGTTNAPASAYFSLAGGSVGAHTQRTQNALVPSPVIFGSLPAGINPSNPAQSEPWRTLLFCPYPAADTAHPGFGNPSATPPIAPDHLILDNFWMPVVEPYPISTCMTTDGKINLNDQIAPFTYLHRNTALHALLTDLRIPAIAVTAAGTYKSSGTPLTSIWNAVDENATIAQIENRFANNSVDAYLSESEICTVPLVPQNLVPAGTSVTAAQTALDTFWNGSGAAGGLTGDNLRELPYAQLYGRLTTRSNSYTVHMRVQVLKKLPQDPNQNVWNEGVDLVQGDWRGSYEIERYLDPAAAAPTAGSQLGPYKFRIVSARRFAP
jgi:uncharacterized protein (TIGR02600 family)